MTIIGNDDKAHIPLGIPAANKQSPILMAMEYPVILLDQTFVVLTKHKLLPSVYATREIRGWLDVQWTDSCYHTIFETWQGRCIFLYERLERYIR